MGKNKSKDLIKKKVKKTKPDAKLEILNSILQELVSQRNSFLTKLDELNKRINDLSERVKQLEMTPNESALDRIKKAIEDGKTGETVKPYIPITPFIPTVPFPSIPESNRCGVCGINFGSGGWGYVCSRTDCPSGSVCWTSGYSQVDEGTHMVSAKETLDASCECGANPICMCTKL